MNKNLILILLTLILFIPNVKADVVTCDFNNLGNKIAIEELGYDNLKNFVQEQYALLKSQYPEYKYYSFSVGRGTNGPQILYGMTFILFNDQDEYTYWDFSNVDGSGYNKIVSYSSYYQNPDFYRKDFKVIPVYYDFTGTEYKNNGISSTSFLFARLNGTSYHSCNINSPFMSNYIPTFVFPSEKVGYGSSTFQHGITEFRLQEEPGSTNYIVLNKSSDSYKFYPYSYYYNGDLGENYTTVNLDDYHYVILSLKDYTQNKAFKSDLQVKGMVGITPVYNYGQSEKNAITDRCNTSYKDFTTYPMYILNEDLKNNAVYYVKSCEDNSSFKFDSSIFDITYVSKDNNSDVIVNINGTDYKQLGFDSLSNSANKNEENDFIPGESNNPIKNIVDSISNSIDYLSNIFSGITTITNKMFSLLPTELKTVLITCFSILSILGILKFIRG